MGDSGLDHFLTRLSADPDLLAMGHGERAAGRGRPPDLGLDRVYSGLPRSSRPRPAIAMGSWRGLVPLALARVLQDNGDGGRATFNDASLADAFEREPVEVRAHIAKFGISNIDYHPPTPQQFTALPRNKSVTLVGRLFIDGHGSLPNGLSRMYGLTRISRYGVQTFLDKLATDPARQLLNLPLAAGLSIVRGRG